MSGRPDSVVDAWTVLLAVTVKLRVLHELPGHIAGLRGVRTSKDTRHFLQRDGVRDDIRHKKQTIEV